MPYFLNIGVVALDVNFHRYSSLSDFAHPIDFIDTLII